jgi:hypothetical protein
MIRKSGDRFSEKIMLKQSPVAKMQRKPQMKTERADSP